MIKDDTVTLVEAKEDDISTLIEIEKSILDTRVYSPMLTEVDWNETFEKESVFLIKKNEEVIGNTSFENKGNGRMYISGVVLIPSAQGQGTGKKVMEMLFEKNEFKSATRIDLVTHPENTHAIALYKSLGFQKEKIIPDYFGDGEPRVIMAFEKSQSSGSVV